LPLLDTATPLTRENAQKALTKTFPDQSFFWTAQA